MPKTEVQTALDSINETVSSFVANQKSMQKQLDALDLSIKDRIAPFTASPSLIEKLQESEQVKRLLEDRRGRATIRLEGKDAAMVLQRKQILESTQGFMTTGVMPIDRIPQITPEPRQQLTVRDLLFQSQTTQAVVDFVKVGIPMTIASPVPEGSVKPENALQFNSSSEKVRTIATWIPASKQILDDMTELANFINNSIGYYVDLAEEQQLLFGDNTGENLHGLVPQAWLWSGSGVGYTQIDVLGQAIRSLEMMKELTPTFAVLNPSDWWTMKLLKDSLGRYILGDPQSQAPPRVFDLDIVSTTSMAPGTFLVGSGSPVASEIRDRMELTIEISTEHMDYFIRNLVAVRGEKRLALVVKRPGSYVTGSFAGASSPANFAGLKIA